MPSLKQPGVRFEAGRGAGIPAVLSARAPCGYCVDSNLQPWAAYDRMLDQRFSWPPHYLFRPGERIGLWVPPRGQTAARPTSHTRNTGSFVVPAADHRVPPHRHFGAAQPPTLSIRWDAAADSVNLNSTYTCGRTFPASFTILSTVVLPMHCTFWHIGRTSARTARADDLVSMSKWDPLTPDCVDRSGMPIGRRREGERWGQIETLRTIERELLEPLPLAYQLGMGAASEDAAPRRPGCGRIRRDTSYCRELAAPGVA